MSADVSNSLDDIDLDYTACAIELKEMVNRIAFLKARMHRLWEAATPKQKAYILDAARRNNWADAVDRLCNALPPAQTSFFNR